MQNTSGYQQIEDNKPPFLHNPAMQQSQQPIYANVPQAAPRAVFSGLMGPQSCSMICPNCNAQIYTDVKQNPSIVAWVAGIFMCITCICCICAPIPFCVDSLKDTTHSCPSCGAFIGKYKSHF